MSDPFLQPGLRQSDIDAWYDSGREPEDEEALRQQAEYEAEMALYERMDFAEFVAAHEWDALQPQIEGARKCL